MLIPNNKQKTKLFQYANTARFAYNWALSREQENYKNGGKFISDCELRKEFTQLKKIQEYAWLNDIPIVGFLEDETLIDTIHPWKYCQIDRIETGKGALERAMEYIKNYYG